MRISDWSSDVCSSDLGVADRLGAADALGDILPRHLEVDAAGVAAFGAVHGEEVLHLPQHAVEGPRRIAARRLDGLAVPRVAGPYNIAAFAPHDSDTRRPVVATLVMSTAGGRRMRAGHYTRMEG